MVWQDEFASDGLPDPARWSYDVGGHGWGNKEPQFYTEGRLENARVEGGHLIIEARRESWQGAPYTSARLVTKGRGDWTYGRIEVRAKLPRGRGSWPAIWMLATTPEPMRWPDDGEIVISGGLTSPFDLRPGMTIGVEIDRLGEASVRMAG